MLAEQKRQAAKRIVVIDDHPIVRRGLIALIESEPGLVVGAEAGNCRAGLDAVQKTQPDLVIVDLALGVDDGLVFVKMMKARHPRIPVLVLSMHDESLYAERSLRAGARGYVTKQQLDHTLLAAIHCLLNGETYMTDDLQRRLASKYIAGQSSETHSQMDALSDRELQVFRLIGQGHTTREIAGTLQLSIKTIESYREHIKDKLSLGSSAELAQRATQWVETFRCLV